MNQILITAIITEKLKNNPNYVLIRTLQQMLDEFEEKDS